MEGKEWVLVEGRFMERDFDRTRRYIQQTAGKDLNEAKIQAFQDFMQRLSK